MIKWQKFNIFIEKELQALLFKWKKSEMLSEKVAIGFVQSPIETGYFGRFIILLASSVRGILTLLFVLVMLYGEEDILKM